MLIITGSFAVTQSKRELSCPFHKQRSEARRAGVALGSSKLRWEPTAKAGFAGACPAAMPRASDRRWVSEPRGEVPCRRRRLRFAGAGPRCPCDAVRYECVTIGCTVCCACRRRERCSCQL